VTLVTRRTLRESVQIAGLGLHTGVPVTLRVHPGEEGLQFRFGSSRVAAHPANVTDTTRSTKLGEIGTVEHLMSALAGLEVTDAEIEVDAPEIPGMDGSALPFFALMSSAGLVEIGSRELPSVYSRIFIQEDSGLKAAIAKGDGHLRYVYATGDRWPGEQSFEVANALEVYGEQIAPARTFALSEEIPMILQAGLAKGLDESSALILGPEGYENQARFLDEPARHKMLDLMGDLYLSGVPIRALSVVAEKTGHRANVKLAAMLVKATQP